MFNIKDAYSLAEFLFIDFPVAESGETPKLYDLKSSGSSPMLALWDGDKRLCFGSSPYQPADILMNEVVYHCIKANRTSHALHAGGICKGDNCIILPGTSGADKSTLNAWLMTQGYSYLTDKLIFLSYNAKVWPMTRPISLKVELARFSWQPNGYKGTLVITSRKVLNLPIVC